MSPLGGPCSNVIGVLIVRGHFTDKETPRVCAQKKDQEDRRRQPSAKREVSEGAETADMSLLNF